MAAAAEQTAKDSLEAQRRRITAAKRLRAVKLARDNFLDYVRLSMPEPSDPGNPDLSRYETHDVHELIAAKLEAVERGEKTRLIVTVGPRMGKSALISETFPSWFVGRNPIRQTVVASYGDDLAKHFGRKNREHMKSSWFQQVFPNARLKQGAQAVDHLQTDTGGVMNFVGAGSALTGKGADLAIVDDPFKDRQEANSATIRDSRWTWFTQVLMTRLMGAMGRVVIVMTRWHEDDIVGRLTNPDNPFYDPVTAAQWEVVNLPAWPEDDVDADNDPLGREPGELLWPERAPKEYLEGQRRLDPAGFSALYMGRPAPPEGNFFMSQDLRTYNDPSELPDNLRFYGASDHAVSLEQDRDRSCIGCVGVDEDDNVWVLPDVNWGQYGSEHQTEMMLQQMRDHSPLFWWAEKGHISMSVGPFLRKRMLEENVYATIIEQTPKKDKMQRAQSIKARTSMHKVFFPAFASWWPKAKEELLTFPYAAHDDFVDWLAWIGIGIAQQVPASRAPQSRRKAPETGSARWIIESSKASQQKQASRYLQS